jgi:hypothetical protein
MSGPRLIRDVLALASMLVVLKSIPHYCYTICSEISRQLLARTGLRVLHVNFLIAVIGLRAILEVVMCCRRHHDGGTVHDYLYESKQKFISFSCAM